MKIYIVLEDGLYGYETPVAAFFDETKAQARAAQINCVNTLGASSVVELDVEDITNYVVTLSQN